MLELGGLAQLQSVRVRGGARNASASSTLIARQASALLVSRMNPPRSQNPPKRVSKGAKAVGRAVARAIPVKEPPTVGKPVIIDPVQSRDRQTGVKRRGERKAKEGG